MKPRVSPRKKKAAAKSAASTATAVAVADDTTVVQSNRSPSGRKGKRKTNTTSANKTIASVTPSPKPGRFVVFTLSNGQRRGFDNDADAAEFRLEYGTLVIAENVLSTRQQMENFINRAAVNASPSVRVKQENDVEAISPDDKNRWARMQQSLQNSRPVPALTARHKTTRMSTKAVVVIEATDATGKIMWWFKPPMNLVWREYLKEFPASSVTTNEIWGNVSSAVARDPDKDENTPKMTFSKQKDKSFQVYVFWTFFTIDYETCQSYEAEQLWIEQALAEAMAWMRTAQKHPVYMNAIKTAFSEGMYRHMMQSSYSPTVDQFFQTCRTNIEKLDNLNRYVILDESKTIKLFLCSSELRTKKYQWETENDRLQALNDANTPKKKKAKETKDAVEKDDNTETEAVAVEVVATVVADGEIDDDETDSDDDDD